MKKLIGKKNGKISILILAINQLLKRSNSQKLLYVATIVLFFRMYGCQLSSLNVYA